MKTEQRFYLLNGDDFFSTRLDEIPDDEFIILAEQEGQIYSLEGFIEAFNNDSVDAGYQHLRVINIEILFNH
mgnify:CR=1 FL=1